MEEIQRDFHHPYQPYNIQLDFMNALYDCIEQGQVGIFESPTGTLRQLEGVDGTDDENEPAWIREHLRTERVKAAKGKKEALDVKLAKIRTRELRQKQRYESGEPNHKKIKIDHDEELGGKATDETHFLLDNYDTEGEEEAGGEVNRIQELPNCGLSAKSFDLLDQLGMVIKPTSEEDQLKTHDEVKIFYCSRTHSQLTQFANELRRVNVCSGAKDEPGNGVAIMGKAQPLEHVKYLSLGARKNLCINPQVSRLGSATVINEKCLELQQPGTTQEQKCTFLPNKENESLVNDFRDHTLARVRDIEDLPLLGKKLGVCPYYASRSAIKPSEIVTLPYPLLLQKSAREALGISLKGHIVIIDEAHNLLDAISNLYSVTISLYQLELARAQLSNYLQKFRNKLKGKNRVYITQLVRLVDSLTTCLKEKPAKNNTSDGLLHFSDLIAGKGVDQINLYKLGRYLQNSKLARKVDGYNVYIEQNEDKKLEHRASVTPVLVHIQSFLQTLMNPAADGRYFYSTLDGADVSLKYMLLDPTYNFKDVVEDARAVILAGGTMSPMEDYTRHLFPYLPPGHLRTLSYSHVIPDSNLLAYPLTTGPTGLTFDFTYEKRTIPNMIDELGASIIQIAQRIPDGLVIFFPSYSYLELVTSRWKLTVQGRRNIWETLLSHKFIFLESKGSVSIDSTLNDYSSAIATGKGGLLLSVIGGKMSEGINFSDALGRGVVVVGLPFPNIQSAEWKAKLEYIDKSAITRGRTPAEGTVAAREFYENACMRAVNQSIGRAIRHKEDYAVIMMLDRRYGTERIQGKLPAWIRNGLACGKGFGDVLNGIDGFFQGKMD